MVPGVSGEWSDPERIEAYLGREIPHRDVAESLLLDALPERIDRFLDLGTGDGRLLALVGQRHPEAHGIGIDASAPMLERARRRFADNPLIELHEHDLTEPLPAQSGAFNAIVSALAIHHLPDQRKRSLFSEIRELLTPGGVFANLELVSSPTPELHARFRQAIGRPHEDPSDQLAGLGDQLKWLRKAGFAQVDCRFKWLELTLFVAVNMTGSSTSTTARAGTAPA
ncbi:MAG TPA: class I SAM-dependent methyltransferase [Solirubrobacteraceae bacterium]|jgi:SAM-dependent methyltransferase|nr:class I SAM-dependent methyltransferase [Solirubrobacteraceae bacterium]